MVKNTFIKLDEQQKYPSINNRSKGEINSTIRIGSKDDKVNGFESRTE